MVGPNSGYCCGCRFLTGCRPSFMDRMAAEGNQSSSQTRLGVSVMLRWISVSKREKQNCCRVSAYLTSWKPETAFFHVRYSWNSHLHIPSCSCRFLQRPSTDRQAQRRLDGSGSVDRNVWDEGRTQAEEPWTSWRTHQSAGGTEIAYQSQRRSRSRRNELGASPATREASQLLFELQEWRHC